MLKFPDISELPLSDEGFADTDCSDLKKSEVPLSVEGLDPFADTPNWELLAPVDQVPSSPLGINEREGSVSGALSIDPALLRLVFPQLSDVDSGTWIERELRDLLGALACLREGEESLQLTNGAAFNSAIEDSLLFRLGQENVELARAVLIPAVVASLKKSVLTGLRWRIIELTTGELGLQSGLIERRAKKR